jgi:hypothetical protein
LEEVKKEGREKNKILNGEKEKTRKEKKRKRKSDEDSGASCEGHPKSVPLLKVLGTSLWYKYQLGTYLLSSELPSLFFFSSLFLSNTK